MLLNATKLPQFLHGTSVYAVGRLGLELARIELARDRAAQADTRRACYRTHIRPDDCNNLSDPARQNLSISAALKKQLSEYSRLLGLTIQHRPAESRTYYSDYQPGARTNTPDAHGHPESGT